MYEITKIPMFAKYDIEGFSSLYDSHKKGEVFYYDPDSIYNIELKDAGYLEDIPNNLCSFYCNMVKMIFGDKEYRYGEEIDISQAPERVINNLLNLSQIKKVLINKEKPTVKKYIQISKELGFEKFADFKAKVKELCNINIQHHNNTVTEEQENTIYEVFK